MPPTDKFPAVSVITPVRNGETTLEACRASVAGQSFSDWEHILIDDGSRDGTRALLERFKVDDGRVRLVLHDASQGAAAARNAGIRQAKGRFIAFLDTDDRWLPDKLAVQTAFMLENEIDLSYGAYIVAGRGGGTGNGTVVQPPQLLTYGDLLGGCPIGCLTAMYDRKQVGTRLFPSITRGQDWALWLEIARMKGRIARHPGIHAVYQPAQYSLSSNKVAKLRDVWHIYRVLEAQSRFRSLGWLARHALHVAAKRVAVRPAEPSGNL